MNRKHLPRSTRLVAIAVGIMAPLAIGSSAQAANQDGTRNNGEFVFYYNSNILGSYSDFANSKSNLAGYAFLKPGFAGYGQAVKNNSASVYNENQTKAVRVYFNSGWTGVSDYIYNAEARNLSVTYNENASFKFLS